VLFIVLCGLFLLVHFAFHHKSLKINSDAQSDATAAFLAVSQFVGLCHSEAFPVFIVEPRLLNALASEASSSVTSCGQGCLPWCHYLCTNYPVTTFGITGHVWKHMESTLDKFRDLQFSITTHTQPVAFSQSTNGTDFTRDVVQTVPVYCDFVYSNGHMVRLVIFHRRTVDKHLWHGQLPSELHTVQQHVSDITFGQHAGVFSSIELVKVVLDGIKLRAPRHPAVFLAQMSESLFKECDHEQANTFYTEYGARDESADVKRFYIAARNVLATAKLVLDSLGVRFWLSSGTCLGWFRQCDLIPYSKDVDIGIWIKDYRDDVIAAMQNSGLELIHRFGKVEDSFELSFLGKDDVKLDIFFFYDESGYMWNGGTQARTGKKFKYIFERFTLCWTAFLGLMVRVPCDTRAYVTANYGVDWFRPVKSWDWKSSPANVHENGEWPEHEWNVVIQQFE
jgi:hypothetical protein